MRERVANDAEYGTMITVVSKSVLSAAFDILDANEVCIKTPIVRRRLTDAVC